MFFAENGYICKITGVYRFTRQRQRYATPPRDVCVLSLRLRGTGQFFRDGAVWDAGPDRLLFLPPKIAYQQETNGEEVIAVHLEIPALRERTIETCAAPDGAAAAFEAMHRAWRDGQYYRCCGVLYDCLACVCTARPEAGEAADGGAHALAPALDAIRTRYRDPDLAIPALAVFGHQFVC